MDLKQTVKVIKKAARELHKSMRGRGGFHGPPKGKKTYSRREKHKNARFED